MNITCNKYIIILLFGLSVSFHTKAQKVDSIERFKMYAHMAGMPSIGSRYGLIIKLYKPLSIDVSYGNSLLDYFRISLTGGVRTYGMGLCLDWSINEKRTIYAGVGVNNLFSKMIYTQNSSPTAVLRTHFYADLMRRLPSGGFTMHLRSGILINTWNDAYTITFPSRFSDWNIGLLELGVGYTFKVNKTSKQ